MINKDISTKIELETLKAKLAVLEGFTKGRSYIDREILERLFGWPHEEKEAGND